MEDIERKVIEALRKLTPEQAENALKYVKLLRDSPEEAEKFRRETEQLYKRPGA